MSLTSRISDLAARIGLEIKGLKVTVDNKEPGFAKLTGFNKNFGTTAGTVAQGNDSRFTDARTPTAHEHDSRYKRHYGDTSVDVSMNRKEKSHLSGYRWLGSTAPPGASIGVLTTNNQYSDDWVNQEFISISETPDKYIRSFYNGTTWGTWFKFLHTGNFFPGTGPNSYTAGNDSRLTNGQTAFGWGNHSSAGYLSSSSLNYLRYQNVAASQIQTVLLSPGFYNVEGEIIDGLPGSFFYIQQLGSYNGGGYRAQIAIPYGNGDNTGSWIRVAVGTNWGTWFKQYDSNNFVSGTGAGNYVAGNDSRLSDARTPTAHSHDYLPLTGGTLSGDLTISSSNMSRIVLKTLSDPINYKAELSVLWDYSHQMSLTGYGGNEIIGQYSTNTSFMYGNIGIGTTTPIAKLHVNGNIRTDRNGITIPSFLNNSMWSIGSDSLVGDGMYIYNSTLGYIIKYLASGDTEYLKRVKAYGSGFSYSEGAFEAISNTSFPSYGFHKPGSYGAVIQARSNGSFYFMQENGSTLGQLTASFFNGDLNGNATTAMTANSALYANSSGVLKHADGVRTLSDRDPNWSPQSVTFDFVQVSVLPGATGAYGGVMTFIPYNGATSSTGDSSYQLAFLNETGINGSGLPGLKLRKGIDTTWGSWYNIVHSGNVSSYITPHTGLYLPLTGGTVSGTIYAPDFVGNSDIRLKENIKEHNNLEIKSNYKNFQFKNDFTKQLRVGVIAQELEETNPEFVRTDLKGMKSVSYIDLHSAEIAYLKAEVKRLSNLIN